MSEQLALTNEIVSVEGTVISRAQYMGEIVDEGKRLTFTGRLNNGHLPRWFEADDEDWMDSVVAGEGLPASATKPEAPAAAPKAGAPKGAKKVAAAPAKKTTVKKTPAAPAGAPAGDLKSLM